MIDPENPQAEQMRHSSMLRTLRLQVEAIWPQESPLIDRYTGAITPRRILDVACGTGEATALLAEKYPAAEVIGVDIEPGLLHHAKERCTRYGERIQFHVDNAFDLSFDDNQFDLVVCRHLLQILPRPERAVPELARVTRPGGWVHVLSEDYGMLYFHPTRLDNVTFWREGPVFMGQGMGTNMTVGRATLPMMQAAGLDDIQLDYIIVDTLRVPRATFIGIWEAWRDGYTDIIADCTAFTREEVTAHWEDMLDCLHNPEGYGCWQIPLWVGQKPVGL